MDTGVEILVFLCTATRKERGLGFVERPWALLEAVVEEEEEESEVGIGIGVGVSRVSISCPSSLIAVRNTVSSFEGAFSHLYPSWEVDCKGRKDLSLSTEIR